MIKTYAHKTKKLNGDSYGASYFFCGPLIFRVQQYGGKTRFYIELKYIFRLWRRWDWEIKFSQNRFDRIDKVK